MQLQQIDYAPTLPNQKRRRAIRRVAMGLAALLIAILAVKSAPPAWQHVQILYWQHRAMTYTAPADHVVYDDDPVDAAKLRTSNPSMATGPAGEVFDFVEPWDQFYKLLSPPGRIPTGTVFLHERTSTTGERRLVVIEAESAYSIQPQGQSNSVFRCTVIQPGGLFDLPTEPTDKNPFFEFSGPIITIPGPFKWYAGQADPTNSSRFTIQGFWKGHRVQVDGWLRDDHVDFSDAVPLTSPAPSSSAKSPPSAR
jgi:hypothetical protein